MTSMLWGWSWVRVSGPSMVPALHDGDRLLVRYRRPVRAGDVVLATFSDLPGLVVVKRAVRPDGDGWWVTSDNQFAGGDSASHGVAAVIAVARAHVPSGRRWPRRIPSAPVT